MRSVLTVFLACVINLPALSQFNFSDSSVLSRIRRDIYVLASDSFMGREAGTIGEVKARNYIIMRLREADVRPLAGSGYLQAFPYGRIQFLKPAGLSIGPKSFEWRKDFGVSAYSSGDSVTAAWIDGGSGLVMPLSGIDSYKGIPDVSGKIVLIDLGLPGKSGKIKFPAAELSPAVRIANAVGKGAAGVILYNDPGLYSRRLFDFTQTDSLTIPVMYASSDVIDCIRNHPNLAVSMAVHFRRVIRTCCNVTGYIDNGAARTIILGGHYDHLGKSMNPKYNGAYCVGADDNASGTAGILELARYYARHKDPRNNYLVVLFSAEELGLIGSEYFVKHARAGFMDSVNFMLNFDMIGRLGCEGMLVTAEAAGSSSSWPELYKEVKHPGFRLKKVYSSLPFSDQDAFYKKGIPVLYLTTGLHQLYHTPADRPETLNFTGMNGLLAFSEDLVNKAGAGTKVPYRKVPEISLYMEMFGFVFEYIGDLLSF